MKRSSILLIDDDVKHCELLAEFLCNDGFSVSHVQSGPEALDRLMSKPQASLTIDAIVLDVMMPDMSGLEVLQSIRLKLNIPIIMLTGKGDDIDRILGLEMGADDYMSKPCNARELAARLRAILRRTQEPPTLNTTNIKLHGIELHVLQRSVSFQGEKLSLTNTEYRILELLMKSPGQVVSKETISEKILNRELAAFDRSIDVHLSRVRQKLEQKTGNIELIKTIRGSGYMFLGEA